MRAEDALAVTEVTRDAPENGPRRASAIDRGGALANDRAMAERLIVEREAGGIDRWLASDR
jgi:hypothetical protein